MNVLSRFAAVVFYLRYETSLNQLTTTMYVNKSNVLALKSRLNRDYIYVMITKMPTLYVR